MSLTVRRIDPLTMSDQLKALFVKNERPEYPEWFDRAYPIAVRDGASSWVSIDSDGGVIAHVAGFPATISFEDRDVSGALLCNLMADAAHRTFFPVLSVLKRAVKDLRQGGAEFIYTNPINSGSVAVMRAAGLREIGIQNRFMMPVGHRLLPADLVLGTILRVRRLWSGAVVEQVDVSTAAEWTLSEGGRISSVSVRRHPKLYFMRHGDIEDRGFAGFLVKNHEGRVVGAAIARLSTESAIATLITLRCSSLDEVTPTAVGVGLALRELGMRRVNTSALEETPYAEALQRAGFIQRNDPWTIVAAGYTEAGRAVADGLGKSALEKIDVD